MKQKCILVANGKTSSVILTNNINSTDYLVGVDKGAILLLQQNLLPNLAIGDFDSVSQKELQFIKKKAKEIKILKKEKDYTDTELAIKDVLIKGYKNITILGAIGTRFDHTIANILLLEKYHKKGVKIKIIDENNEIELITDSVVIDQNSYQYISFISLTDSSSISLIGFKYILKNKRIKRGQTLCISNELVDKKAKVMVKIGKVLTIKSKD